MSTLKRVLALSLALMLALSLAVFATDYKDQEEIDPICDESIDMLVALNVLNKDGYGDGTFRPSATITRAQAAKMIYVICNGGVDDGASVYIGANTFQDVANGSWYAGYVEYCYAVGIIAGRGNDKTTGKPVFDPEASITGYELAKMLLVTAEYNPVAEQYTGENWTQNVLKHARTSGLLDNYSVVMSAAAPRQWAAVMMSNLILKVDVAQYIGDLLVNGTNLLAGTYKTVGEVRMNLITISGVVMETPTLSFRGGTQEKKDSIIAKPNAGDGAYATNDNFINLDDKNAVDGVNWLTIGYDIPNKFLGKEVKIVAKAKNRALTGNPLYSRANMTVYAVYETGLSIVTAAKMSDLGWGAGKSKSTIAYNDRIRVTLDDKNYNFYFDVGVDAVPGTPKATDYLPTDKTGSNTYNTTFQDFLNERIMGNDFDLGCFGDLATGVSGAKETDLDSAKLVADWISNARGIFTNRNDDVLLYDIDGNGTVDFVQVLETTYHKVSSINATRVALNGLTSMDLEEVNFTNGTPVRNDIVALTENYASGECVYDIAIIEGTSVKASAWTFSGSDINTVKLDGSNYYLVNKALAVNGTGAKLNQYHESYFIDRGYVVYSSDATGASDGKAPEDTAVITKVGEPVKGAFGWSVSVRYLNAAGTSKTATYDIAYSNDAIGGNTSATSNALSVTTVIGGKDSNTYANRAYLDLKDAMDGRYIVQFEETDGGVAFYEVKADTYSDLTLSRNMTAGKIAYDADSQLMKLDTKTYELSDNATVWAQYNGSWKKVAVSDLKTFETTYGAAFGGALVDNNNVIVAVYIDFFAKDLPTTDSTTYLVITAKPYTNTTGVFVPVLLPDGTATDVQVSKIVDENGDSITGANAMHLQLKDMTFLVVKYSVSSSKYTLTMLNEASTSATSITNENSDRFYADGWYTWDSDTVIYYIVNDTVSIMEDLVYGGDVSTFVITGTTTGFTSYARYIIVNGDDDNVVDTNITPKVAKAKVPAVEINKATTFNAVNLSVTNDAAYTYSWSTTSTVTAAAAEVNALGNVSTYTATKNFAVGDKISVKVTAPGYNATTITWTVTKIMGNAPGVLAYSIDSEEESIAAGLEFVVDDSTANALVGTDVTFVWKITDGLTVKTIEVADTDGLVCDAADILAAGWTAAAGDVVTCTITSGNFENAQTIIFTDITL